MRLRWTTMAAVMTGTVLAAATAVPAFAQADFQWRGRVSTGQTIEIKGVNGDVSASPKSLVAGR